MSSRTTLLFVICVLGFIISCSNKKESSPKDVLPVSKFINVMYDLSRADQYVADYVLRDSAKNKKTESIRMYEAVFQIHKTSQAQFKKSMDYYSSDPVVFRPIIDSIASMKKTINTGANNFPFKRDSNY